MLSHYWALLLKICIGLFVLYDFGQLSSINVLIRKQLWTILNDYELVNRIKWELLTLKQK